MSKVEEELRAAFERQEASVPDAASVRGRIDFAWVRVRRRRARRRALGAAAAVLLAGAAVPVVSTSWWHGGQPVAQDSLIGGPASVAPPAAALAGPVDVLLIGSDHRVGSATERADTIMLLHVPADRAAAWMVSLPRDGLVDVPGHGEQKLTTALALGGPKLIGATVTKLTGVTLDATVTVDLAALSAVADEVDGVRMCLDQAIPAQSGRKALAAGCQRIDGDDVAPLLQGQQGLKRFSLDRDRNNQRFLRALAAKVIFDGSGVSPATVNRLLVAAGDGVRLDGDAVGLLRVIATLGSPDLIGIGEPVFNSRNDGEIVDSPAWLGLYRAIRDDDLARWSAANPTYVDR
ncbi:LCP family protein [Actinoplanes sp. HUAS TT8]|uniref:LCP family protein n=1 Tax=Actinoplanes sp. HUAS TT8 TaxID=3447453 RepID=UPI003F529083